jgi:hypothetical protein
VLSPYLVLFDINHFTTDARYLLAQRGEPILKFPCEEFLLTLSISGYIAPPSDLSLVRQQAMPSSINGRFPSIQHKSLQVYRRR